MYNNPTTHNIISKNIIGEKKEMKTKIIIGTILLILLIGSVTAFEIKDLKPINGYDEFDVNGQSNYTTNNHRYIYVEKIATIDDEFINEWFTNHTEHNFTTSPVGDNIFYFEDQNFNFYGYQEVVNIDGTNYMVSINQESKLSPSEKTEFLNDLKEFNKQNNIKPISVT